MNVPFVLLALTFIVNLPLLSPRMVLVHDTLHNFIFFHYAYSEVFLHHDFPKWIPLIGYGQPFDYNLFVSLLPTDLVVMTAGCVLGIQDALLLYKISAVLSQGIFVLGTYLLVRKLCTAPAALWLVCLGAILTTSWTQNYQWNFTSYYLMPLVLYYLMEFFEGGSPRQLWRAAILETLSLIGTIPYIAPLHLLMLTTFTVPFLWSQPGLIRRFVHWRTFLQPLFAVFVVFLVMLGWLAFGLEAAYSVRGRDAHTGAGLAHLFGQLDRYTFANIAGMLLAGDVPVEDTVCFVGILPLTLMVYGMARRRDAAFWAVAAVPLVLFWFAQGGWFSHAAYYCFPLMKMFRHIGCAMNLSRIFLLLAAGMGFDRLLADLRGAASQEAQGPRGRRALLLLTLIVALWFVDFLVNMRRDELGQRQLRDVPQQSWYALRPLLFACLFVGFAAALRRFRQPAAALARDVAGIVLLAHVADAGAYYVDVLRRLPVVPPEKQLDHEFAVAPLGYRPERPYTHAGSAFPVPFAETVPMPEQAQRILDLLLTPRGEGVIGPAYASWDLMTRQDHVAPALQLDMVMPGVKQMIEARGGEVRGEPAFVLPADLPFLEALGWKKPKIRMVAGVRIAADEAQAVDWFQREKEPQDHPVLLGPAAAANAQKTPSAIVDVAHFSANRMVIDIVADKPGWLYCADAWHPAWRAWVNGRPVPVLRANLGFKAIPLDAGQSEVVFRFEGGLRDVVRAGIPLFAAALGFILVGAVLLSPWQTRPAPAMVDSAAPAESATDPSGTWRMLRIWSWATVASLLLCAGAVLPGNSRLFLAAALVQVLTLLTCRAIAEFGNVGRPCQE